MFSQRETATLLAALQYWREEMLPHGRAIMQPYFRIVDCDQLTPLHRNEIARLATRLQKHLESLGG